MRAEDSVRAIEIVGEAASKVSLEARLDTPQIPWAVIIGMRNRLVHAYFETDHDVLWATVSKALPELLAQLEAPRRPQ